MMLRKPWMAWLLMGVLVLLIACGGGTRERVAPVAAAAPPPVRESATLILVVADVARAAEQAAELARSFGGYRVSAQAWSEGGTTRSTLVLRVPRVRFAALREAVHELGRVEEEVIAANVLADTGQVAGDETFTTITLTLYPVGAAVRPASTVAPFISAPPVVSAPPLPVSRPERTLRQAWAVTATIFSALFDVAIWLVVVLGPFATIAVVGRWLYRRYWRWGIAERPSRQIEREE